MATLLVLALVLGSAESFAQETTAPEALLAEASAAARAGDFRKALPILERAVAVTEPAGGVLLARALVGLGWAQWGTGRYDTALATHERALTLFRSLGDAAGESQALLRSGETLFSLGRYHDALRRYDEALEANARAPDAVRHASILSNQGSALRFLGRYDEAVAVLDRAAGMFRDAGDDPGTAMVLTFLGIVNRARGEYGQAIAAYTSAVALRQRLGDKRGEAQTVGNLGNVYRDLGQIEQAVESYTRSLRLAEESGYTAQIGFANQSLGSTMSLLGRSDAALARFEAALAIWRTIDRKPQIGWTLREIGLQHLYARADPAAARRAFDEALALARTIGEPEMEGYLQLDLGDVAARDPATAGPAERAFGEALAVARRIKSPKLEHEALAERGRLRLRHGRTEEGLADLRASVAIVTDLRAKVVSDQSKVTFLDTRQRVFHDLAAALVERGRAAEGLEAAEAARARAFADLLEARQLRTRAGEQSLLRDLRSALTDAPAATLDTALGRLRSQNAELASLVSVESPDRAEIAATAQRLGATIIEYLVTETALMAWVVRPSGAIEASRVAVTAAQLGTLVREALAILDESDPAALRAGGGRRELQALHDLAIAPLAALLPPPGELLVIVPHGPLALVPFAAMLDAAGSPLAARHPITTAPSASVFRYTAAKRRDPRAGGNALIVAAPQLPADADLPPLPGSLDEGQRVAARLRAPASRVLVGAAATERAVKERLGAASLIHFATHGLISEIRPSDSSLVLAASEGEDGYLKVGEVFGLDLAASLVVLSGCSTGRGRLTGDGIFGLSRAFIYAGTPAIVVSLWDVSDRATAFLMDRFYAELGRSGNRATALQAAQLATRERYPHPALWAPFILVGEPR